MLSIISWLVRTDFGVIWEKNTKEPPTHMSSELAVSNNSPAEKPVLNEKQNGGRWGKSSRFYFGTER